jgi:hypothetical protein
MTSFFDERMKNTKVDDKKILFVEDDFSPHESLLSFLFYAIIIIMIFLVIVAIIDVHTSTVDDQFMGETKTSPRTYIIVLSLFFSSAFAYEFFRWFFFDFEAPRHDIKVDVGTDVDAGSISSTDVEPRFMWHLFDFLILWFVIYMYTLITCMDKIYLFVIAFLLHATFNGLGMILCIFM